MPFSSPGGLPDPGSEPSSSALQADSLPSEPPGQALKNTGVGCHALLQGIFLTQGSSLCLPCLLPWQVGSLALNHPESTLRFGIVVF